MASGGACLIGVKNVANSRWQQTGCKQWRPSTDGNKFTFLTSQFQMLLRGHFFRCHLPFRGLPEVEKIGHLH